MAEKSPEELEREQPSSGGKARKVGDKELPFGAGMNWPDSTQTPMDAQTDAPDERAIHGSTSEGVEGNRSNPGDTPNRSDAGTETRDRGSNRS